VGVVAGAVARVAHLGLGSSLKVTGTRAGASSLRNGYPTQSSGIRMRARSGWPVNVMPNRSYTSRSPKFAPGYTSVRLGADGSSAGTSQIARMRRLPGSGGKGGVKPETCWGPTEVRERGGLRRVVGGVEQRDWRRIR